MASRIHEIDGIRSIALIGVLFYHARVELLFTGGFVGVDIFFVISGYVITLSVLKEISKNNFDIRVFILRRIYRLCPALIVTLIVTNQIVLHVFAENHRRQAAKLSLAATFSVSNFSLWLQSNYFDLDSRLKPYLHTWSLSLEWQFYLSWACILFITVTKIHNKRYQLLCFTSIMIISIVLSHLAIKTYPSAVFYNIVFRYFEFMCGCIPAWLKFSGSSNEHNESPTLIRRRTSKVLSSSSILVIGLYFLFFKDSFTFPGLSVLPLCVFTSLLIVFAGSTRVGDMLSKPVPLFLGDISYSVYLVHWPILVVLDYFMLSNSNAYQRLLAVALSIPFGFMLNRCVERPFYSKNNSIFKLNESKKRIILVFLISMNVVQSAGIAYFIKGYSNRDNLTWSQSLLKKSMRLQWERKNENRGHYGLICHMSSHYKKPTNFLQCNPKKSREIVVFGDSHAQDFYAALNRSFWPNASVIQMTAAGFSFTEKTQTGPYEHCQTMYDSSKELLASRKDSIFAAIIASRWKPVIKLSELKKLNDTIRYFRETMNAPVWVIGPRPEFSVAPLRILETKAKNNISRSELDSLFSESIRLKESSDKLLRAVVSANNATYVSATDVLCTQSVSEEGNVKLVCNILAMSEKFIYYTDRHHINSKGALKLMQSVIPKLKLLLAAERNESLLGS